jgi:hypothetical protein
MKKRFDNDPTIKQKISKKMKKAVEALDSNGKVIHEFPSAKEAKGFNNTNIGQAIKHKKLYKGFYWRFKNEKGE